LTLCNTEISPLGILLLFWLHVLCISSSFQLKQIKHFVTYFKQTRLLLTALQTSDWSHNTLCKGIINISEVFTGPAPLSRYSHPTYLHCTYIYSYIEIFSSAQGSRAHNKCSFERNQIKVRNSLHKSFSSLADFPGLFTALYIDKSIVRWKMVPLKFKNKWRSSSHSFEISTYQWWLSLSLEKPYWAFQK